MKEEQPTGTCTYLGKTVHAGPFNPYEDSMETKVYAFTNREPIVYKYYSAQEVLRHMYPSKIPEIMLKRFGSCKFTSGYFKMNGKPSKWSGH